MEDWSRLESFVLGKMSETKLPGLSLALVKNGSVVYARGFGYRDVERGLPETVRTVHGVGSITKSFTALALMTLVEEGRLSLNDPASKYLPVDLRVKGKPVTIHNLLTHTSGLPALAYAEGLIRGVLGLDATWTPIATSEDVISYMSGYDEWAVDEPGRRFFYLNEGYALLGMVISRASGLPYEEFVREKILRPLKMERSYFREAEVVRDPEVAEAYVVDREGRLVRLRFPYGPTADGGLLSNCLDMSRYVAMLVNRGDLNGVRVASRESVERMEGEYARFPGGLFGDESYGYGLIVTRSFWGTKLVYHGGSVLVHTAFMGYAPSERAGVVVLANASGYPLSIIGVYALSILLGKNPDHLPFVKRDRVLSKLQGVYESFRGSYRLAVRRRGDFLLIEYRDRLTENVTPFAPLEIEEGYARFYTESYGRRLEAEFFIEGDRITMIYERYKAVKVGDLPRG